MYNYYVNKNALPTGEHEVHRDHCKELPLLSYRINLGRFKDCKDALREAATYYENVDGCKICSSECYTRENQWPPKKDFKDVKFKF
jgi:hypothetical protein